MKNLFVTDAAVAPSRWREAFPDAGISTHHDCPAAAFDICWLHCQEGECIQSQVQQIAKKQPVAKVVVMSNEPTEEEGLEALTYGARGYCNAHAAPEVLHQIEEVLARGGVWVGEALLARFISALGPHLAPRENSPAQALLQRLSERERMVALRIADGQSNKEIARALEISERTVKAHLSAAFEKLHARDRLQLALLLRS